MTPATRTEHDSLGDVQVSADALWGAQTQRSLQYFRISTERMPLDLLMALARVKRAAALVNADLGLLDRRVSSAIDQAAQEVMAHQHDAAFPLSVWQTGSGTQTNMNMNEVLANRASEILGAGRGAARCVHPNDHVNLGQSSNDVFPTAMYVAAAGNLKRDLLPALGCLRATLADKAQACADIVKIGRTHLQDATPLTLGQEMSGWVAQLDHARKAIESTLPALCELAIGGTAVGNGLNTDPRFGDLVAASLAAQTGLPLRCADNRFAALAAHDALVHAHGALKTLAVALMKIANDVRWLASGPRCGLGELLLPENEPGSSIMPGKVNPTQCEALTMVCCQVMGHDVALSIGGASGQFELNVFKPLMAYNFLQSVRLLSDAMAGFDQHCARGMTPDKARIDELLHRSLMLVTALVPHIGYDRSAEIARRALAQGSSLREAALALGHVSPAQFDEWMKQVLTG
ncbi:MAG TPA: class II fumarate hydratase [Aquabacterium sp.]|uniref:class II fumarate hydratase n=1 Tax=Aquabacterium sp. TaxID=1872578 RepID=UPI002E3673F7|nr:class II fumarate hydratase [Aquabacterium sp.]HEX5356725.1 class II fumarate hydratase [Aquabacterium sp.]